MPTSLPTHQQKKVADKFTAIGSFQVAVGAIIEDISSGKILLLKRTDDDKLDPGGFEPVYGRLSQFEDPKEGLLREIQEETGLTNVKILEQISSWHIYRGAKIKENEVIGLTFWCQTDHQPEIKISAEHQAHAWVEPKEVLSLIKLEGVKKDLQNCFAWREKQLNLAKALEREQRSLADYQNLVRRINQEKAALINQLSSEAIGPLLTPLEHLSLAAKQIKNQGLDMTIKEFWQVLLNLGLEEFNPLGKTFDAKTMAAIERQGKGEKVLKVTKLGFLLNGKVIQHAQVIVG